MSSHNEICYLVGLTESLEKHPHVYPQHLLLPLDLQMSLALPDDTVSPTLPTSYQNKEVVITVKNFRIAPLARCSPLHHKVNVDTPSSHQCTVP